MLNNFNVNLKVIRHNLDDDGTNWGKPQGGNRQHDFLNLKLKNFNVNLGAIRNNLDDDGTNWEKNRREEIDSMISSTFVLLLNNRKF